MTDIEQVRLALALARAVPGASLSLRGRNGSQVVVGAAPGNDMASHQMRQIVLASTATPPKDYLAQILRHIVGIRLGGSLEHLGGGIHRRTVGPIEQRWIAVFVPPDGVRRILTEQSQRPNVADVRIVSDTRLEVTCVTLNTSASSSVLDLDAQAASLAAACFTAELIRSSREQPWNCSDTGGGAPLSYLP